MHPRQPRTPRPATPPLPHDRARCDHGGTTSSGRDDFADRGTSDLRRAVRTGARRRRGSAMEIINLGAGDGLPPVDWAAVTEKLDAGSAPAPDAHNARTTWLTTVNEDGSPHVTAVGALWLDGTYWFQTGAGTRKGRNVGRDPRCSIAVSIRDADVVVEGDAARVTDPAIVARVAKAWADTVGRRSPTRAVPASPHRSTHRRKDRRRGTCIASSPARRPSCWAPSRAASLASGSDRWWIGASRVTPRQPSGPVITRTVSAKRPDRAGIH